MINEIINLTNQQQSMHLAEIFNQIAQSNRRLLPVHSNDCGTIARAIFIYYILRKRGDGGLLTPTETQRLQSNFSSLATAKLRSGPWSVRNLEQAIKTLQDMTDGIMICSLRFAQTVGHVWIIMKFHKETRFPPYFAEQYHLYQCSLNNYSVTDHIKTRGVQIDGPGFLREILPLLYTNEWNKQSARFYNLFWYIPNNLVGQNLRQEFPSRAPSSPESLPAAEFLFAHVQCR
jgi:hypothetical protein